VTEVFMIENSWWQDSDCRDEGHANLKLYATEEDAKEALSVMAHGFGIILSEADTSFSDGDDTYFINRYEVEGI
jgi:hypothetical protein